MSAPLEPRVHLRPPRAGDADAFVDLRRRSRTELEPFEAFPEQGPDPFGPASFERFLSTADSPRRRRRLILRNDDDLLLGAISLTGITRGVLQTASLDYWLGTQHTGQGYMGEALALTLAGSFGPLELHRVEALVLPGNVRSRRLLERADFELEGLARSCVRMRGEWRDQERWVKFEPPPE